MRTWIAGIAANKARNFNRVRRLRQGVLRAFGSAVPADEGAVRGEMAEAADVKRALAKLSDKHREVLVLAEVKGFTGPEIAEVLGISTQNVWTRLHRARKAFAHLYQRGGGSQS